MEHGIVNSKALKNYLLLDTEKERYYVLVDDIFYCKAGGDYTCFYIINGHSILISKTLKKHVLSLNQYGFIRIHASYLVNINKIMSLTREEQNFNIELKKWRFITAIS